MPGLRNRIISDIKTIGNIIINSKDKAFLIADLSRDKKAEEVVIMDMRGVSSITDFFVIAQGNSAVHTKAIGDWIKESLKKRDLKIWHIEGYREANWILLDYGDVIVHIFQSETRKFYNLERLWGDAPLV